MLSKIQNCIVIRGGIHLWIPAEKMDDFDEACNLARSQNSMIRIKDQRINPADVVGVFTAVTMEETTRRKNGEWQCKVRGVWHNRGDKCSCKSIEAEKITNERFKKFYEEHGFYPPE